MILCVTQNICENTIYIEQRRILNLVNFFNMFVWLIVISLFTLIIKHFSKLPKDDRKPLEDEMYSETSYKYENLLLMDFNCDFLWHKYFITATSVYLFFFFIINIFFVPRILNNVENNIQAILLENYYIEEDIYKYASTLYTKNIYLSTKSHMDSSFIMTCYISAILLGSKFYSLENMMILLSVVYVFFTFMDVPTGLFTVLPIIHQYFRMKYNDSFQDTAHNYGTIDNYLLLFIVVYYFSKWHILTDRIEDYNEKLQAYEQRIKPFPKNNIIIKKKINNVDFMNFHIYYQNSLDLFPYKKFSFHFPQQYKIVTGLYKYIAAKQMCNHYEFQIDNEIYKGNSNQLLCFFDSKFPLYTKLTVEEFLKFWTNNRFDDDIGEFGYEQVYYLNSLEKRKLMNILLLYAAKCNNNKIFIIEDNIIFDENLKCIPNAIVFI